MNYIKIGTDQLPNLSESTPTGLLVEVADSLIESGANFGVRGLHIEVLKTQFVTDGEPIIRQQLSLSRGVLSEFPGVKNIFEYKLGVSSQKNKFYQVDYYITEIAPSLNQCWLYTKASLGDSPNSKLWASALTDISYSGLMPEEINYILNLFSKKGDITIEELSMFNVNSKAIVLNNINTFKKFSYSQNNIIRAPVDFAAEVVQAIRTLKAINIQEL